MNHILALYWNEKDQTSRELLSVFYFSTLLTGIFTLIYHQGAITQLIGLMSNSAKVYTSHFNSSWSGLGGAFLNAFLIQVIMCVMYTKQKKPLSAVSFMAFFLTFNFTFWGLNMMNIWCGFVGVLIACKITKRTSDRLNELLLFSCGIAPIYSDILFVNTLQMTSLFVRVLLVLSISIFVGLCVDWLLTMTPKWNHGYCLYNAALPLGILSTVVYTVLYRLYGHMPAQGAGIGLSESYRSVTIVYMTIFFGCLFLYGVYRGGWPHFIALLKDQGYQRDYLKQYGLDACLINMSTIGFMIMLIYLLGGASFNGVTFGVIICTSCTAASGNHLRNMTPILVGYFLVMGIRYLMTVYMSMDVMLSFQIQGVVVGMCYATGLSPITGRHGAIWGVIAGMLHLSLVLYVPLLHGSYCLYNGGFTANIIACVLGLVLVRMTRRGV